MPGRAQGPGANNCIGGPSCRSYPWIAEYRQVTRPHLLLDDPLVALGKRLAPRTPALGVGDSVVMVSKLMNEDTHQQEAPRRRGREPAADLGLLFGEELIRDTQPVEERPVAGKEIAMEHQFQVARQRADGNLARAKPSLDRVAPGHEQDLVEARFEAVPIGKEMNEGVDVSAAEHVTIAAARSQPGDAHLGLTVIVGRRSPVVLALHATVTDFRSRFASLPAHPPLLGRWEPEAPARVCLLPVPRWRFGLRSGGGHCRKNEGSPAWAIHPANSCPSALHGCPLQPIIAEDQLRAPRPTSAGSEPFPSPEGPT